MSKRLTLIALAACGWLFLLALPAQAHDGHGAAQVEINEQGFSPEELEVEAGTTVEFTNTGSKPHWPASDIHPTHQIYSEFDPQRSLEPGKSWEFTFNKAGIWRMHDHVQPASTGIITVTGETIEVEEDQPNILVRIWRAITGWVASIFTSDDIDASANILDSEEMIERYVAEHGIDETADHLYTLAGNDHGQCHNSAHLAGRFAYEQLGSDIFTSHIPVCHSGTIHGATEAFFAENGATNLNESLPVICNTGSTTFYLHECLHGVGHGLMAWTAYDIHEALEFCDLIDTQPASCYSGVFMENVVGGLSGLTGHTTEFLSNDPHMPCNVVGERYKYECYVFQTSRMLQVLSNNYELVAAECQGLQVSEYQSACFNSLGRDMASQVSNARSIELCTTLPPSEADVEQCLSGAVHLSFLSGDQADEAVEFCSSLTTANRKSACYNVIQSRATSFFGDFEAQSAFCNTFEPDFVSGCLSSLTI